MLSIITSAWLAQHNYLKSVYVTFCTPVKYGLWLWHILFSHFLFISFESFLSSLTVLWQSWQNKTFGDFYVVASSWIEVSCAAHILWFERSLKPFISEWCYSRLVDFLLIQKCYKYSTATQQPSLSMKSRYFLLLCCFPHEAQWPYVHFK